MSFDFVTKETRQAWKKEEHERLRLRQLVKEALESPEVKNELLSLPPTKFIGYDALECEATIVGVIRV